MADGDGLFAALLFIDDVFAATTAWNNNGGSYQGSTSVWQGWNPGQTTEIDYFRLVDGVHLPEPTTMLLLAGGCFGLIRKRRKS